MKKSSHGIPGASGSSGGRPSYVPTSSAYYYSGGSGPSERSSNHHYSSMQQERKCDSCGYRVAINECQQFKCKDCGTYIVLSMMMIISKS